MTAPKIQILTDVDSCGGGWSLDRRGLPFLDWETRCAVASIYGVAPRFLLDEATGTVLPLGTSGQTRVFFGGLRYSECNGFLGPLAGRQVVLEAALNEPGDITLLALTSDVFALLDGPSRLLDVPFNQYWIVPPGFDLALHLATLHEAARKEVDYLLRKFTFETVTLNHWPSAREVITRFVALTAGSFARRGRSSFLDDPHNLKAALTVCEHAARAAALGAVEIRYRGEIVGLCIIVDDPACHEAVYLISLCGSAPSKVSNAVTLAPMIYAGRTGRRVNGMRGAFSLKKKYGYVAEPAFALVRSASWQIRPQVDLTHDELIALYGREFGCHANSPTGTSSTP